MSGLLVLLKAALVHEYFATFTTFESGASVFVDLNVLLEV